ncbi:ABC transporter permease [Niabella drilacis]|uniref:Putative ABC transport system permease protein n=1 Tax=Niabella drilacis (strain DSM 25811 / CCM 8410 / CCUG 62505 / LMG 26954 / E90) TaxID=1285928 RepID=A0A1G7AKH9_NIADE|nr:ABC transporter permease [Niabella drilacis]SDE14386.1 putative ABC transport system permease protein [Niabella drilacis]
MFKKYFKTALRNLLRNRTFSVINVTGLAFALAAFWLIMLFVADELSYDRYHAKSDRIFRLVSHGKWDGGSFDITGTSGPMAAALKKDYPEIEATVRLDPTAGGLITYAQKHLRADDVFFADSNFFSVFSFPFLAGDPYSALLKPQSIVLTRKMAVRLFGTVDAALNKIVYFQNKQPEQVTGVVEDVPENSHFTFSAIRSFPADFNPDWSNFYLYTYGVLRDKKEGAALQEKLPGFVKKYLYSKGLDIKYDLELQPLTSIHLHSNVGYELGANRSMKFIYIFCIVALLILSVAVINYINITTARASVRLREIAVRKVIGSGRKDLVCLFLAESVTITIGATLLSALLAGAFMPVFNQLAGKSLQFWHFGPLQTVAALLLFAAVLGATGGLYPALFLSGFKPVPALKNQIGKQPLQALFRKTLVVFQFTITVVMIVATLVVYCQLRYMTHKDLGFDKNQVLTFRSDDENMRLKSKEFRNSLLADSRIEEVAFSGSPIGNNNIGMGSFNVETEDGAIDQNMTLAYGLAIDEHYIPTMRIRLLQGRNFNEAMLTDSNTLLVNAAFVKKTGWKNAIGKGIQMGRDASGKPVVKRIIGVTSDFHTYSLQHKIEPLVMHLPAGANEKTNVYVRVSRQDIAATTGFIGNVFRKFDAISPFEYNFLDRNFRKQYQSEEKQGKVLLLFTIVTIGIACLGLLGLITFTTAQRVKEIGIRKVLGASGIGLVRLLSTGLLKLVIIALVIAIPVAWLVMNKWLGDFAYRVHIRWWMFMVSGGVAFVIAGVTLSFQTIKAAIANPAKALRSE